MDALTGWDTGTRTFLFPREEEETNLIINKDRGRWGSTGSVNGTPHEKTDGHVAWFRRFQPRIGERGEIPHFEREGSEEIE